MSYYIKFFRKTNRKFNKNTGKWETVATPYYIEKPGIVTVSDPTLPGSMTTIFKYAEHKLQETLAAGYEIRKEHALYPNGYTVIHRSFSPKLLRPE